MIQTTNQYIFDSFDVQWIGLVGKSETVETPFIFHGKVHNFPVKIILKNQSIEDVHPSLSQSRQKFEEN